MTRKIYGNLSLDIDQDFVDYTVINYFCPANRDSLASPLLLGRNSQSSWPNQITITRRAIPVEGFPLETFAQHQLEILTTGGNDCDVLDQRSYQAQARYSVYEQTVSLANTNGVFVQFHLFIQAENEIILICGSSQLGEYFEEVKEQSIALMESINYTSESQLRACA